MKAEMLHNQITKLTKPNRFKSPTSLIFILAFAGIGSVLLFTTRAAGPFASLEPEQGTIAGAGCTVGDTAASGGSAVQFGGCPTAGTANQVSQYGITWIFDKAYPVGQFVNGDWWVEGPVTITSITPGANISSETNGWNINPLKGDIGYDGRLNQGNVTFQAPSLPRTVPGGSSIVKGISYVGEPPSSHRGYLQTAAVLTVVADIPVNNGATVFRPPYFGTEKPLYSTASLRLPILPMLPSPGGSVATLSDIARKFERVQLDHATGDEFDSRRMHPQDNMQDYGGEIAIDTNSAALRLMLNDTVADKMPALVNYVQAGIDWSAMLKAESVSRPGGNGGGHSVGRFLPIVFAATLLDSPEIKTILQNEYDHVSESYTLYWSANAPIALWGDNVCTITQYNNSITNGTGSRSCRDPYGYIDGGQVPARYYQECCTSQPFKGAVTAAHLMPELQTNWPEFDKLSQYVDRWVDFGAWTQPDPHNRYFTTEGLSSAQLHGTGANSGNYRTPLADSLWSAHNLSSRVTLDYNNL